MADFLLRDIDERVAERIKEMARQRGWPLNDVILHTGKTVHMIEFELYVEGDFVYRLRSDGLIVCTPTGSTAYALSGGGPILHPRLDAIGLVPMHPHTLSSRPIVVDGNSEIKIKVLSGLPPMVSADGQPGHDDRHDPRRGPCRR